MAGERFIYQKGDIEIKKSQCGFCKYEARDNKLGSEDVCGKFPNGKPEAVVKNQRRCSYLEY